MSASGEKERAAPRAKLVKEILMEDLGLTQEDVDEALRGCGIKKEPEFA